jgi:deoxyribodipyrimidine photolyase-related protein
MGAGLGEREVLFGKVSSGMIERILYIPFDHLDRRRGVLKDANPATDVVVLVESQRMLTGRPWHPERLFFLVSSARHFANALAEEGFQVRYIPAPTTVDGLRTARDHAGDSGNQQGNRSGHESPQARVR